MNSVERYYQKKKKRKKKAKVAFFSLLFVLMVITLAILSMTVFFNAEEITVSGNTRYSAQQLLEQGDLTIGQNLFRLDKFEVIHRMKQLPYVKDVVIKRKLPNTLVITVVENEPVVWLSTVNGAALLNEEYRLLGYESLPVVQEGEEAPPSPVDGVPQLTEVAAELPEIGGIATFGEVDYTGFLKRLYDGFSAQSDLSWDQVDQVQFFARYDIKVLYADHVTIDFGTLDQTETKIQLAAYLIGENGTGQTATVEVSNTERVYYRPKKAASEPLEKPAEEPEEE